jgi:hypothetical protein
MLSTSEDMVMCMKESEIEKGIIMYSQLLSGFGMKSMW